MPYHMLILFQKLLAFSKKASRAVHTYVRSFITFERKLGWREVAVLCALILGIIAGVSFAGGGSTPIPAVEQSPRGVEIRSVADLSGESAPLPLVGVVRSQSEADVRTESSGQIVRLYRQLGDYVAAGSVIAEMDNSRERAAVTQAQAGLDAARANLAKVSGGTRDEQLRILEAALKNARQGAVNVLLSAYAGNDEAVRRKADQMFSSPDTSAPKCNLTVTDSQLVIDLQNERTVIRSYLARESGRGQTLTEGGDLDTELTITEVETRAIKNFLDKLTAALNKSVPSSSISESTIASYTSDANAARSSVTAALSAIAGTRQALEVARRNLEQGRVGGQAEDVATAEAQVKQAEGSLASARATLEKTIVRAPISGTLNSLTIKRGDFVSAFTSVLTIANNNALEVVSSVTERDARELSVGAKAIVKERFPGVVTRIAPAIDPVTRKIEVRIGLIGESDLLNGEAVVVELSRVAVVLPTGPVRITIPLSALKVGVTETVVFTLGEGNTLLANPVTIGELLGDRVVIEAGLTLDMNIVLDARGLRAGEVVTVKE